MNEEKLISDLTEGLHLKNVLKNEPMNKHTTFKVGGPADILVIPENIEEIKRLLEYVRPNNLPYFIIGNGSNLIVKDKGIRGIVIKILDNFNNISRENDIIEAEAGAMLSRIAVFAMNESLSGLEFAGGIPGTLGGAIFMNAGAYGGEMSNVVEETTYINSAGEICVLPREQHCFGYRKSFFSGSGNIILKSKLKLIPGVKDVIKARMEELNAQRREKQPLSMPSAGSVFKRPEGYYTGKLIQDAGLRGYSIGGAQVSEKHSGFIVNTGNATAGDITDLISYIQEQVRTKYGVELETEVKIIGED